MMGFAGLYPPYNCCRYCGRPAFSAAEDLACDRLG